MKLNDDMIALRALEPTDLDVMYRWENDSSLWRYGSTAAPYSRHLIREYIANYDADIHAARQLRLMVTLADSALPVGAIDLTDYDPLNNRAQIGILIDRDFQRQGLALRALVIVEDYCRERLGMHQLWAIVPVDNAPCRRLFEAAGYKISGHLRSWIRVGRRYIDAYHYYKLLP